MFLETNHPKGTRVQFPGVYCQGAIIFGVIFQEQSSREQLSGGNCLGTDLPSGQLSSGAISRWSIIHGAIVWGGGGRLSRRGNCLDTLINGFSAIFRLDQNDRDGSILLFRAILVFTQCCPSNFLLHTWHKLYKVDGGKRNWF